MSIINILSPHLADMIAAGEVVERPASVIKELMENSIDAGAKNITVEIRDGGASFIRVADDGCGMSPDDAGVAFTRHATSKLRDERGLEAIGTMGFRGEALAAISAVSVIELTTCLRGDSEGTRVVLEAGEISDMHRCGCPEGTVITVKNLFYNTPARLKFLKSDRSESAACLQAALRTALGSPFVSVRFIRDGKEEFFSPGDGRLDSAVYGLLGRDFSASLLPVNGENGGVKVEGFISSPSRGSGNRTKQFFYCNGRFIKSALIQSALEQSYKNTLLTGRYPDCVLYLTLSFGSVDVNVHPAKTEVKFSAEKAVFDAVYYSCFSALTGETSAPEIRLPESKPDKKLDIPFYKSMTSEEYRKSAARAEALQKVYEKSPSVKNSSPFAAASAGTAVHSSSTHIKGTEPRENAYKPQHIVSAPIAADFTKTHETRPVSKVSDTVIVENSVQNVESRIPDYRITGEVLNTYIVVDTEESVLLIDKHAAHERMIFDRLREKGVEGVSQLLLVPVVCTPTPADMPLIEENGELLAELGFELEPYGEGSYAIRAVPGDIDAADAVPAIEEFCEALRKGRTPDKQTARDEALKTVACKAAIKAGRCSDPSELKPLVEAVISGRIKYCPHGRPVSVRLTRKELDKQFKRIV